MRCYICNAVLQENEIKHNKDHQKWDPCGKCLDIISEVFESKSEEEIEREIEVELEEGMVYGDGELD